MACQLYRKDGKVDKVLAPNGKNSILYRDILNEVNKKGVNSFLNTIGNFSIGFAAVLFITFFILNK